MFCPRASLARGELCWCFPQLSETVTKHPRNQWRTESGPWYQSLQLLGLLFMVLWRGWTLVQKSVVEKKILTLTGWQPWWGQRERVRGREEGGRGRERGREEKREGEERKREEERGREEERERVKNGEKEEEGERKKEGGREGRESEGRRKRMR